MWRTACPPPPQAYLRLAKIKFGVHECATASASPSGAVPAVESREDLVSAEPGASGAADEFAAARSVLAYLRKHTDLDAGLHGQQVGQCSPAAPVRDAAPPCS